jgi:hypothetical protein
MKPTIGRIVIYKTTEEDRKQMEKQRDETGSCNVQEKLPAIVVAVWSSSCVNLWVIGDGEKWYWKTSVQQGDGQGQWNWPEKETPQTEYPVCLGNERYSKLFAIQSKPEQKFFLKDKEIGLEKLLELLEKIDY